ncbi:MAG: alpha/beta fold hydrolase [Bacillota bacterium]|nr:alpha/beta fold hydrolase [Candidatus Fermentithermobacillaceae bacterium]
MAGLNLLEEFLKVKYLGKWDWSPDGRFIAYIWDNGGVYELWLVEPGQSGPVKTLLLETGVSDFEWLRGTDKLFAVTRNGLQLICVAPDIRSKPIFVTRRRFSGLSCSPDGSALFFVLEGRGYVYDVNLGSIRELDFRDKIVPAYGGKIAQWSPSGKKFAFSFRDSDTYRQIGVVDLEGRLLWKSHSPASLSDFCWFDEDSLYFAKPLDFGTSADLMLLSLSDEKPKPRLLMHLEGTGKGPLISTRSLPSPDKSKVLFLLENDGRAHYYVLDRNTEELKQVTFGQCEDFGNAGDQAVWLNDSSGFLYSSNKQALGERHIFKHCLKTGTDTKVIGLEGTNSMAKLSSKGKICFVHCDQYRNMDIWVANPDGQNPVQVTFSMPEALTPEKQFVSEEVSFESAGGLTIYGYLMKPKNIAEGTKIPALVWVHGGPVRQMRPGWHPLRTYALFHGLNQYLVHRGYAVLSVNFRGGIGYGRDFRNALFHKMGVDDVADVVNAAKYLKSLPYVDPDRVGVWGISYGGYMTLHSLTQYPDVFKAGVNIAGIWDFIQWTKWADGHYGKGAGLFKAYLGGEPEDSPKLYAQASPVTFVDNMIRPLLNLHGTADANVDFEQLDRIAKDCVEHGKCHENVYYPGEAHTFAKKATWLDAMHRIERFLDQHLKKA